MHKEYIFLNNTFCVYQQEPENRTFEKNKIPFTTPTNIVKVNYLSSKCVGNMKK